jgi:hypothetical protein
LAPLFTPRNESENRQIGKGSTALRAAVSDAVASGSDRRHLNFSLRRTTRH